MLKSLSEISVSGKKVTLRNGSYTIENIRADHVVEAKFIRTSGGGTPVDPPMDPPVPVELTFEGPTKRDYLEGDMFDPAGLKVTVHYSDGSHRELSDSEYTYSDSPLVGGQTCVTISYEESGETVSVDVEVTVNTLPPKVTGIVVTNHPDYVFLGKTIDPKAVTIEISYDDSHKETIDATRTDLISMDGTSWTTVGEKTVTMTYMGDSSLTAQFDIQVPAPKELLVKKGPNTTTYVTGSSFSMDGMVVEVVYDYNSLIADVTDQCAFEPGIFTEVNDDQPVELTYSEYGYKVDCTIHVTVRNGDGFKVMVTEHSGTRVEAGKVESFHETDLNERLSEFSFDLDGIVPGVTQTATLHISNDSSVNLHVYVYIGSLTDSHDVAGVGDPGVMLSERVLLSSSKAPTGQSVLSIYGDTAKGGFAEYLDLGVIGSNGSMDLDVTLSFPNASNNNDVMGKSMSFTFGIFADAEDSQ